MKFLSIFRVLSPAAHPPRRRDDNIRAGEYRKAPIFTPWTMLVS